MRQKRIVCADTDDVNYIVHRHRDFLGGDVHGVGSGGGDGQGSERAAFVCIFDAHGVPVSFNNRLEIGFGTEHDDAY